MIISYSSFTISHCSSKQLFLYLFDLYYASLSSPRRRARAHKIFSEVADPASRASRGFAQSLGRRRLGNSQSAGGRV